ncbi:MAG: polymer-forming cytoskeletal protein [Patescibacteria group bacterium]
MAVFSKEEGQEMTSETIIGPSVKVEGNFSGEGNIIIQGTIEGSLSTSNDIQIEEGAKVDADIEANNLSVSGEINGNVKCHGKTELTGTAKITGNVETEIISIETGASINGQCNCTNREDAKKRETETNEDAKKEKEEEDNKDKKK